MSKDRKLSPNGITDGVIWEQLLLFFFPIVLGTFFQQLYNTADAIIVGKFVGKEALAAVGGTTGTLINLLVGFFVGLSSGATVVISQHYGANKEDKVQWAVHTSIAFSILGGIVLTVVGIGCSRWMLDLMNTPDDVVNHALIYMRVYFLGTIGNLIYNMGSGILRAVGDPDTRFTEDALRILRGVRFASELGFAIEDNTAAAMRRQLVRLSCVAAERVREELTRLLCGRWAQRTLLKYNDIIGAALPELVPMFGCTQDNPHHCYDVWGHTVRAVGQVPSDPCLRWAMLLHDSGKPACKTVD